MQAHPARATQRRTRKKATMQMKALRSAIPLVEGGAGAEGAEAASEAVTSPSLLHRRRLLPRLKGQKSETLRRKLNWVCH